MKSLACKMAALGLILLASACDSEEKQTVKISDSKDAAAAADAVHASVDALPASSMSESTNSPEAPAVASTSQPAAPEAQPAAPEAQPAAPEAQPAAPEVQPAAPEAQPAAPVVATPAPASEEAANPAAAPAATQPLQPTAFDTGFAPVDAACHTTFLSLEANQEQLPTVDKALPTIAENQACMIQSFQLLLSGLTSLRMLGVEVPVRGTLIRTVQHVLQMFLIPELYNDWNNNLVKLLKREGIMNAPFSSDRLNYLKLSIEDLEKKALTAEGLTPAETTNLKLLKMTFDQQTAYMKKISQRAQLLTLLQNLTDRTQLVLLVAESTQRQPATPAAAP